MREVRATEHSQEIRHHGNNLYQSHDSGRKKGLWQVQSQCKITAFQYPFAHFDFTFLPFFAFMGKTSALKKNMMDKLLSGTFYYGVVHSSVSSDRSAHLTALGQSLQYKDHFENFPLWCIEGCSNITFTSSAIHGKSTLNENQ